MAGGKRLNHILHVERENKNSEHVMIIKTVLTKNFNSIIITFDKKNMLFYIQIGNERVLMYPSEFGELIDILVLKLFIKLLERGIFHLEQIHNCCSFSLFRILPLSTKAHIAFAAFPGVGKLGMLFSSSIFMASFTGSPAIQQAIMGLLTPCL